MTISQCNQKHSMPVSDMYPWVTRLTVLGISVGLSIMQASVTWLLKLLTIKEIWSVVSLKMQIWAFGANMTGGRLFMILWLLLAITKPTSKAGWWTCKIPQAKVDIWSLIIGKHLKRCVLVLTQWYAQHKSSGLTFWSFVACAYHPWCSHGCSPPRENRIRRQSAV